MTPLYTELGSHYDKHKKAQQVMNKVQWQVQNLWTYFGKNIFQDVNRFSRFPYSKPINKYYDISSQPFVPNNKGIQWQSFL